MSSVSEALAKVQAAENQVHLVQDEVAHAPTMAQVNTLSIELRNAYIDLEQARKDLLIAQKGAGIANAVLVKDFLGAVSNPYSNTQKVANAALAGAFGAMQLNQLSGSVDNFSSPSSRPLNTVPVNWSTSPPDTLNQNLSSAPANNTSAANWSLTPLSIPSNPYQSSASNNTNNSSAVHWSPPSPPTSYPKADSPTYSPTPDLDNDDDDKSDSTQSNSSTPVSQSEEEDEDDISDSSQSNSSKSVSQSEEEDDEKSESTQSSESTSSSKTSESEEEDDNSLPSNSNSDDEEDAAPPEPVQPRRQWNIGNIVGSLPRMQVTRTYGPTPGVYTPPSQFFGPKITPDYYK